MRMQEMKQLPRSGLFGVVWGWGMGITCFVGLLHPGIVARSGLLLTHYEINIINWRARST
jgi:hypothetical protein